MVGRASNIVTGKRTSISLKKIYFELSLENAVDLINATRLKFCAQESFTSNKFTNPSDTFTLFKFLLSHTSELCQFARPLRFASNARV